MNVENIKVTITSNVAEYKGLLDELVVELERVDELLEKINSTPLELKVV